jgi:DNA-binding CsgD family transcriptional regulator/PAS domain-containing protein
MKNHPLPIIGEIYEASFRPDHWPVVLEELATLTRSQSAMFIFNFDDSPQTANPLMSLSLSYGIEDKWIKAYNDYFGSIDPSFRIPRENAPLGVATADHKSFSDRTVQEQHEFYTGYMRPQGLYHKADVLLFEDDNRQGGIEIHRTRDAGYYEDETLQLVSDLAQHFQRALRIHTEFTQLRIREQALYAGFDKLAMGMVLFDPMGQVVYVNPMAESILKYHPSISLIRGSIMTYDPRQGVQLHQAIFNAVNSSTEPIAQKTYSIGLSQPDNDSPLPVLVAPICKGGLLEHVEVERIHAAMYFTDPTRQQSIAPEILQQIYGMTEREAQVAVGLCNGLNAAEISRAHDISYHTARTHIRGVFDKTGVKSHPQLVKLLLSGPFLMTGSSCVMFWLRAQIEMDFLPWLC